MQKEPSTLKGKLALSMPPLKFVVKHTKSLECSHSKKKKRLFTTYVFVLRATPSVLSMLVSSKLKLGKENPRGDGSLGLNPGTEWCADETSLAIGLDIRLATACQVGSAVVLPKTNWVRKIKTCQFGSARWLWPSIFAQFAESQQSTAPAREECNMI
jgi:hypothetical protein